MSDVTQQPSVPEGLPHSALDRIVEPLRKATRRFGLVLLFVLVALPAMQVLLRTILHQPFVGSEELTRFMLICVVFVTLPYVISSGTNIRMGEIAAMLPHVAQRFLLVLGTGFAATAFGIAAYSVAVATLRNLHNATPSLGIPYWIFFSVAFFGLLFSVVESAVQFVKALGNHPIYVTFADEHSAEEIDLERALTHEPRAGRGA